MNRAKSVHARINFVPCKWRGFSVIPTGIPACTGAFCASNESVRNNLQNESNSSVETESTSSGSSAALLSASHTVLHSIQHKWHAQTLKKDAFTRTCTKEKFYILSMFPYPSGSLHMGHVRVYTIADALARYMKSRGFNVLNPIGFDAFGLPTENASIEHSISPSKWTIENIKKMRLQLNMIGIAFDWDREIHTCDVSYYKWTQALFVKMYEMGYIYRKKAFVNWDPIEKSVLANEQVDKLGRGDRSGALVEKKYMEQWFVKTTALANELVDDLDILEWPEIVKNLQRKWIGREERTDKLDVDTNQLRATDDKTHPHSTFKLHDWLISRQRYWGTPIPIIHCSKCGAVPVPEEDLPIKLPYCKTSLKRGESLLHDPTWKKCTCPKCGNNNANRESDTMDTFMDSAWYWLKYLSPNESECFIDKDMGEYALPVDLYIGGIEHSTMHLLYARFIGKFLHRYGISGQNKFRGEPFKKFLAQGMVLGKTYKNPYTDAYLKPEQVDLSIADQPMIKGTNIRASVKYEKMSKSKYNGVDPISILDRYGSDATRLYMLHKAAPQDELIWEENGISGMQKWLISCVKLVENYRLLDDRSPEINGDLSKVFLVHDKTLMHVSKCMSTTFQFHTAISSLIKFSYVLQDFIDTIERKSDIMDKCLSSLATMLYPFAPCVASHMYQVLGKIDEWDTWPIAFNINAAAEFVPFILTVNGKKRGILDVPSGLSEDAIRSFVLESTLGQEILSGKIIKRTVIPVKKNIINFVI